MDWRVYWFREMRNMPSKEAAIEFAERQVLCWTNQGAPSPEYRVVYQPTGETVHTIAATTRKP